MPDALKSEVNPSAPPDSIIPLPASFLLEQLRRGSVKFSFKLLKTLAPKSVFSDSTVHDAVMVEVPLTEVLSRVKPDLLVRRPGQRQISVPDDVTFTFQGMRVLPSNPAHATRTTTCTPRSLPVEVTGADTGHTPVPAKPVESVPEPMPSISAISALPTQGGNSIPSPSPGPKPATNLVIVPLSKAISAWPELLRRALESAGAQDCVLKIPASELEFGIRRGKLSFTWKQLKPWITPTLPSPLEEHDALTTDLPLAEVAPQFIAQKATPKPRPSADAFAHIPDIFSAATRSAPSDSSRNHGNSAPRSTATIVATKPPEPIRTTALSATTAVITAYQVDAAAPVETKPSTQPAEVIAGVCKLPGVLGALFATPDGLLVLGELPKPFNAEALAGFLPQMFQRAAHYAGELQIGVPSQLSLTVAGRVFTIHKVSGGYLNIISRVGETVSEAQITALTSNLIQFAEKE